LEHYGDHRRRPDRSLPILNLSDVLIWSSTVGRDVVMGMPLVIDLGHATTARILPLQVAASRAEDVAIRTARFRYWHH
jgi:hypothetical protein